MPLIVLISDSHGQQWMKSFYPYFKERGYGLIHLSIRPRYIVGGNYKKLLPHMNYKRGSFVVISHLLHEMTRPFDSDNWSNYLDFLKQSYNEIYVIQDTTYNDKNPNLLITNSMTYIPYCVLGINCSIVYFPDVQKEGVTYINMTKYICNDDLICPYIKNGKHVYQDQHHLNLLFAETLSKEILVHFAKKDTAAKPFGDKHFFCMVDNAYL